MTVIRYSVLSSISLLVLVIGQTEVLCLAGENVVLEAIEAVEKASLFESDYGFLKRWAYVETQFGQLSGFLGGIWRIDNQQLKDTQMEAQNINGSVWREKINQAFGINWVNVELKDLKKPLVSCLAARILLLMTRTPIPVLLVDQASVYQTLKAKENNTSSKAHKDFIAKATEYEMIKALESADLEKSSGQQRNVDNCNVFTLKTGGLRATSNFVPGIYDSKGKRLVQFHTGYNIITVENGSFVAKQFYIWDGNNMKEMATYLESLPLGKSVIVASWDDGARNRDQNGIPDLMYNIGASKGIFGGTMLFRSMYVLFGRRGLGEGKGKEFYSGKIDEDPNAFVTPSFYVSNDVIISETAVETGTYNEEDPCLATRIKHVAGLNLTSALDQAFLWRQSKQVSNAMNILKRDAYTEAVKAIAGAEASKVQKGNPEVVLPALKKHRFLVNLTCDCPKSSNEVFSLYTLKTNGLSAQANFVPGVYDESGKQVVKLLNGVNVIFVVNGTFVAKAFYIFHPNNTVDLAKYLESIPKGKTVIVATMDDGKDNRMSSGIPELMYDMGASIGLFGENMKFRSVYVLVGQRGIGQGKGKEYYRGETDHNANSWLTADFYVKSDTIFADNAYQLAHSYSNGFKICSNVKQELYFESLVDMQKQLYGDCKVSIRTID